MERASSYPRRGTCRQCFREGNVRPRDLCHACYSRPDIRELHPPRISPRPADPARILDGYAARPLPATPTDARPGSPEKVAAMASRADAGASLWHPLDRLGEDE